MPPPVSTKPGPLALPADTKEPESDTGATSPRSPRLWSSEAMSANMTGDIGGHPLHIYGGEMSPHTTRRVRKQGMAVRLHPSSLPRVQWSHGFELGSVLIVMLLGSNCSDLFMFSLISAQTKANFLQAGDLGVT